MSDEERKDPNTTISGPSTAKRHLNGDPTLNAGLVAVIFQGIRTSIAKEPYIFVIFQGGLTPPPPSGSAHDEDAALGLCQFILILLRLLDARLKWCSHI